MSTWNCNKKTRRRIVSKRRGYIVYLPEVQNLKGVADAVEQDLRRDAGIARAEVSPPAQKASECAHRERIKVDPGLSSPEPQHTLKRTFTFFYVFYVYVLNSYDFFAIMIVEHIGASDRMVLVDLILSDFLQICSTFFIFCQSFFCSPQHLV